MLVLSRKINETIVVNPGEDEVVIVVTQISKSRVRLGLQAPPHVKIVRQEVLERENDDAPT